MAITYVFRRTEKKYRITAEQAVGTRAAALVAAPLATQ